MPSLFISIPEHENHPEDYKGVHVTITHGTNKKSKTSFKTDQPHNDYINAINLAVSLDAERVMLSSDVDHFVSDHPYKWFTDKNGAEYIVPEDWDNPDKR